MQKKTKDKEYILLVASELASHLAKNNTIMIADELAYVTEEQLQSLDSIFQYLDRLFQTIEKNIEERRNRISEALVYENKVREFTVPIVDLLLKVFEEAHNNQYYRNLLTQRHIAYCIYSYLNQGIVKKEFFSAKGEALREIYTGLVNFYEKFYGHFSDNEEAIELICKYYPEKLPDSLNEEKVANALYPHISNAGTIANKGFAYNGIKKIKENIGNLPGKMVKEILKKYYLFEIINNDVYRRQIFTIIHYSCIEEEEKYQLKFYYLDFLLIANAINIFLAEYFERKSEYIETYYWGVQDKAGEDKLVVFVTPEAYWEKGINEKYMQLMLKGKIYLQVCLEYKRETSISQENSETGINAHTATEIYLKNLENKEQICIEFDYADWKLDYVNSKETGEKINMLIRKERREIEYKNMFFSLLYLNQYRGMRHQIVDFDHEFSYDYDSKSIQKGNSGVRNFSHFYGKNVYSLTCIVGKNGTGKTSIVDFLRETFFKMLKLIEVGGITCDEGYVAEKEYKAYNIFDAQAEFLIVFRLDSVMYYLTNIEGVKKSSVTPFNRDIHLRINEFSKVVYFSNMLRSNQIELYKDIVPMVDMGTRQQSIKKVLEDFRQVDYSEAESFIRKRRAIENEGEWINRDLCYQVTFLKNTSKEVMEKYLELEENKEFYILNKKFKITEDNRFTLAELEKTKKKIERLEKENLYHSDVWIKHFSSGQYVKFSFLAKLYWFLEGYIKEKDYYESIIETDKNEFGMQEVLGEDDTALIFIDEGELFYHPEWQRRYIHTMLDMINSKKNNAKLQIVITTNSPFILSDVLKEDVIYLNQQRRPQKEYDSPLGQNIHKLLKDNFFMDYTIGEYSKKLIENLIDGLKRNRELKDILQQYYEEDVEEVVAVSDLIDQIGEIVYRQSLEELAEEYFGLEKENEIRFMEEKIKRMQEEVMQMRNELKEGK